MKYLLLTKAKWDAADKKASTALNIPNDRAKKYARYSQVTNTANPSYGKYIFPVMLTGPWACGELFPDAEDWSDSWITT